MARKNKEKRLPPIEMAVTAEVITVDGRELNPRLVGDIHRWKKAQEERTKRDSAEALAAPFAKLAGLRVRKHVVPFACKDCDRKFEKHDGLKTHRLMKHGVTS